MIFVDQLSQSQPCTHCRSENTFWLFENQFAFLQKKYSLYACGDCMHWFCPVSLNTEYQEHYSRSYDSKVEIQRITQLKNLVLEQNLDLQNKTVLELGCNAGGFLASLKKDFQAKVYGVEIAKGLCEIARKRGVEILDENFGLNFDFIFAFHVLEHFVHINEFLSLVSSYCRAATTVLLSFPNRHNYWVQRGFFPDLNLPLHRFYYSLDQIVTHLSQNGFEVLSASTSEKERARDNYLQCMYNRYRQKLDVYKQMVPFFQEQADLWTCEEWGFFEKKVQKAALGSEGIILCRYKGTQ